MNDRTAYLQRLAKIIDLELTSRHGQKMGFALVVFEFENIVDARTDYVSNANRRDMIAALKELTAKLQGMPDGIQGSG